MNSNLETDWCPITKIDVSRRLNVHTYHKSFLQLDRPRSFETIPHSLPGKIQRVEDVGYRRQISESIIALLCKWKGRLHTTK